MAAIPPILPVEINEKYKVENETFLREVKANPKDRIEVEIGDSKQPDFKPQFKVMRWDNEVNFSLRAEEHPQATVETEGEKIKYITPEYEVHKYDKPELSEDGGFEFEWVLKQKPATNILIATIETKELNFFFQPPLTQQEIDEGASRPENVVGSYAVYHTTKGGMNDVAGMEYKVGKAFHIYRPKVIDAIGTETWGELNIDEQNGLLTVTIPQVFLDNGVYPIICDPTFGYESIGASNASIEDVIRGTVYSITESGDITKLTVAIDNDNTVHELKGAIYLRSDDSLKGVTNETTNVDAVGPFTWLDLSFGSPVAVSATNYALVAWSNTELGIFVIAYDAVSVDRYGKASTYGTFPDPFDGTSGTASFKYSIYATYTAAGGGSASVSPSVSPSASQSPSASASASQSPSAR